MPRQSEKQARVEAMLGELAELGLMVARELAVRTRESEDPEETVALAGAFQKMSRVVRLTLALEAKLERDAAREAREAARDAQAAAAERAEAEAAEQRRVAAAAPRPAKAFDPVEDRKARVGALLNRLLWNECEGEEEDYEVLTEDLTARLDEAARGDDFLSLPIEVIARKIAADMDLSGKLALSLGEAPARPAPASERSAALADTG